MDPELVRVRRERYLTEKRDKRDMAVPGHGLNGDGAASRGQASGKDEAIDLLDDSSDGGVSPVQAKHSPSTSSSKTEHTPRSFIPFHLSATTTSETIPDHNATKKYFMTLREMIGMEGNKARSRTYQWLVIFNFLIDFEYLLEKLLPDILQFHRVVVFYGCRETEGAREQWRQLLVGTGNTVEFIPLIPSDPPRSRTNPLPIKIPYGCHHTKMFMVGYEENQQSMCRVVVHTANLMRGDIEYKTQGIYCQDFPLKKKSMDAVEFPEVDTMKVRAIKDELERHGTSAAAFLEKAELVEALLQARKRTFAIRPKAAQIVNPYKRKRGDAKDALGTKHDEGWPEEDDDDVPFEEDLVTYLESYNYRTRQAWCQRTTSFRGLSDTPMSWLQLIRVYDYSSAYAVLIPSVPGHHKADSYDNFGYLKLRKAIIEHVCPHLPSAKKQTSPRPILCQFSSIGSLNEKWLNGFVTAVSSSATESADPIELTGAKASKKTPFPNLSNRMKIIWPTVEEIRTSIEGYRGGGSVPGRVKNLSKEFLRPVYHRWSSRSDPFKTARHVPHIKTFVQPCSSSANDIEWLCLTSHNLSIAAWGQLQKSSEQSRADARNLFIRSWELGVFMSASTLAKAAPASAGNNIRMAAYPVFSSQDVINLDSDDDETQTQKVLIPLPFDMNPVPYNKSDIPWAVDQSCPIPDSFGCIPGTV